MKTRQLPRRRTFADVWDEIDYLYQKLLYWLYEREAPSRAKIYADRLAKLLPKADPDHAAILGEECWSLVWETRGSLQKAIEHREHEVRLIRRLHKLSHGKPHEAVALKGYGYADLSDRLDLLATLYHDAGKLDKALATLRESKQVCQAHGIPFDGEDLLQEYSEEKTQAPGRVA
jgi:hypothetical protein